MSPFLLSTMVFSRSWQQLVTPIWVVRTCKRRPFLLHAWLLTSTSDQRVINHLAKQYNKKNDVDITKDLKTMGKLKREVEKAKRTLSSQMSTRIEIESFHSGNDFSETLTRAKFEELNMDLVCRVFSAHIMSCCADCRYSLRRPSSPLSKCSKTPRSRRMISMISSWLVDLPEFPRSCLCWKPTSTAKRQARTSILMKLLLLALPFK